MEIKHKIGNSILKCEPIAHVIHVTQKGNRCDYCLKPSETLKRCARCTHMYYCDAECQTYDWKFHKLECKYYPKVFEEFKAMTFDSDDLKWAIPMGILLQMRVKLMVEADETFAKTKHKLYDNKEMSLMDMSIHNASGENSIRLFNMMDGFCQNVYRKSGIRASLNDIELTNLVVANTLSILDEDYDVIGIGIYIGAAFGYSCAPNAAFVFNGRNVNIVAIKLIATNEPIVINKSHFEIEHPKEYRLNQLKSLTFCDGNCFKCLTDSDAEINYKKFNDLKCKFKELKGKDSKKRNEWINGFEIGLELIPYYRAIYGNYHPIVGVILHHVIHFGVNIDNASKYENAIKHLIIDAQKIIINIYGNEHVLYKKFIETVPKKFLKIE